MAKVGDTINLLNKQGEVLDSNCKIDAIDGGRFYMKCPTRPRQIVGTYSLREIENRENGKYLKEGGKSRKGRKRKSKHRKSKRRSTRRSRH